MLVVTVSTILRLRLRMGLRILLVLFLVLNIMLLVIDFVLKMERFGNVGFPYRNGLGPS